ncbi:MAG TPA: hypothetical protein VGG33_02075 [Polyangia bacterium]
MINRTAAALMVLDGDVYRAALQAQTQAKGSLAVVVSSQPAAELQTLMEKHLGSWSPAPGEPTRAPKPATMAPSVRKIRLYQGSSRGQDFLRFGCRLPPATETSFAPHELLGAIVRHEANQVRESWGATYGFEVRVVNRPGGVSHLTVHGHVDPSRTADAVRRLVAFIGELAMSGPSIKTFLVEKWNLGRAFNLRFASSKGVSDGILEATQMGWSPTMWDVYPEALVAVGRDNVRDLVAGCVNHEAITIVGDTARLTAQLTVVGLAP